MVSRSHRRRSTCGVEDAKNRLHDAEAFLEIAEIATDPDVKATNAFHSAIAASDAICCVALGERSSDGNHSAAVELLSRVDGKLSNALNRALNRKTQAGYESRDIARSDAELCVRQALLLIDGARSRVRAI